MKERTFIKILKELSTECSEHRGVYPYVEEYSWPIILAEDLLDEYNRNVEKTSYKFATIKYERKKGETMMAFRPRIVSDKIKEEIKKQAPETTLMKLYEKEIQARISMIPGFHKLMHHLIDGKSPEFLEGFFEGMVVMKKIDIGEDIFEEVKK